MAFVHGIEAQLSIGGQALQGNGLANVSMDQTRLMSELQLIGEDEVQRVPGLSDINFTLDGAWDATIDGALHSALAGSAHSAVIFSPDGGTTTYTVNCWVSEYSVSIGGNNHATYNCRLVGNGEVTRA